MVDIHPVAKLLTDEMKARVSGTRFKRTDGCIAEVGSVRCPLAVALGLPSSLRHPIFEAIASTGAAVDAVRGFMAWADSVDSRPADVYALLGCSEPES